MSTEKNPADQPTGDAEATGAFEPAQDAAPQAPTAPVPPVPPIAPTAATPTAPLGSPTAPLPPTGAATQPVGGPPVVPAPAQQKRPRPRTSPIVWGALILVFCAYVAVRAAGGSIDVTAWLITTILGLGALLLVVGVAVLVRSSGDRR